jgi:DNA polymerase III subunit gamma/tau
VPGYHLFQAVSHKVFYLPAAMSYLVLARKSRPQTFEEVVGQRPVVKTLQNSLARNRVAHAILFSGVRGVGKTTLARIMAKAINCENRSGNIPCNTCNSCLEIMRGSAMDLHEIDGASNRGIQEIRELKEKIRFLPTSARYKIIIIDEVHMLTTEAFNALLKTLEEPPEHVYFMFATTELHKVPITILSRCQRYELKRISAQELTDHFYKLTVQEGKEIDPQALALIVREAEGSVRDGLSLLDQVFSFSETRINTEDVVQVLGLIGRDVLLNITKALLAGDRALALTALQETFGFGIDLKRFCTDLLECFRTLILCKIPGCQDLLDMPDQDKKMFAKLAADFTLETIHLKLSLLIRAVEEMGQSLQPRLALETAFLKIIEAGNVVPVTTLLGHFHDLLAGLPRVSGQTTQPPPSAAVSYEEKQPVATAQEPEPGITGQPATAPHESQAREPIRPASSAVGPIEEITPDTNARTPPPESRIHPHERDVRRDWLAFTEYVKERIIWMSKDLQRADSARQQGNELHLHYSDPANCALLRTNENRLLLTEFVLDFFQKELKVRFILPADDEKTNGDEADRPQKQRHRLANDPQVQMAVDIFNGQIGDIRIGPRSR